MRNIDIAELASIKQGDQNEYVEGFVCYPSTEIHVLTKCLQKCLDNMDIFHETFANELHNDHGEKFRINWYSCGQLHSLVTSIHKQAVAAGKDGVTVVFS